MSEKTSRRFFIPPWLDDIDLKPHPFRVLCHLLRRAGEDGRCYPSALSIAAACHISKDTVWPALKTLEKAGIITRLPKRFGGSNSYLITPPIGGNEGVIDDASMSGKGGLIEPLQSAEKAGRESLEKAGCQSAEKEGCKEIPLKKATLKKSNRENSTEEIQFANWFKSSLPSEEQERMDKNWLSNFCDTYDKLVRIDKRAPEEIRAVCKWGRTDDFWQINFKSPAKLRKRNGDGTLYFDVFVGRMKQPTGQTSKTAKVNLGGRDDRHAGTTSMEITGDEF